MSMPNLILLPNRLYGAGSFIYICQIPVHGDIAGDDDDLF